MPSRIGIFWAITFAILGAYIVGEASTAVASFYVNKYSISFPIREPFNLLFAFLFLGIYRRFGAKDLTNPPGNIQSLLIGAAIISLILVIAWGFMIIFGAATNINLKPNDGLFAVLSLGLLFMLMHGAAEQLLIQFIAQSVAQKTYGINYGIVIGAISFALLQYLQGYKHPIEIINSLAIGALMAVLYVKYGLLASIGVHAFWSYLEIIVKDNLFNLTINKGFVVLTGVDSYGSPIFGVLCFIGAYAIYSLKKNNLGEN